LENRAAGWRFSLRRRDFPDPWIPVSSNSKRLSRLHDFLIVLAHGATLPWKYEGTPYQKVIDPDGVTTEYVRCPDPTSALVAKITRTAIT
jgi:hypothetical protein